MQEKVGIIRFNEGLKQALTEISNCKDMLAEVSVPLATRRHNMDWIDAIEVRNMVIVPETIIRAALKRKESRGGSLQEDLPNQDDKNWLKHITIRFKDKRLELGASSISLS
jgi:succinate dehydrogenase / fumarate reductase flavoprotein subunit